MAKNLQIEFKPSMERINRLFVGADLKKPIQDAVEKMAAMTVAGAKPVTPIDTGTLRRSIWPEIRPFQARVGPHVDYGLFVHEGTRKMAGRPFLKWGLEKAQFRFHEIKSGLQKQIDIIFKI